MLMENILQQSSRKKLVLTLYRSLLKTSPMFKDPLISQYIISTTRYQFKKEKKTLDYDLIKAFLDNQNSFLTTIERAKNLKFESLKYLIDLTYGQVVFSPRNDYFIQAKYLSKLPFGKKRFFIVPNEGYQIVGPAPIPEEFLTHLKDFIGKYPELKKFYEHLLVPYKY